MWWPLVLSPFARAGTVLVCEESGAGCFDGTLQEAFDTACEGTAPNVVEVSGRVRVEVNVRCGLTLRGVDGDAEIIPEDGPLTFVTPMLRVRTEEPIEISDLRLLPGTGGVLEGSSVDVTMTRVTVDGGSDPMVDGSGIYLTQGGTLEISDSDFQNLWGLLGGALWVGLDAIATVENTTFQTVVSATSGGVAYVEGELTLEEVTVLEATALFYGGTVHAQGPGAKILVKGGVFGSPEDPSTAALYGGVIAAFGGATVVVETSKGGARALFQSASAAVGGAILASDASVSIRHADFLGNFAGIGAAVYIEEVTRHLDHEIDDALFLGNGAAAAGTLVWTRAAYQVGEISSSLTLTGSRFEANGDLLGGSPALGVSLDGGELVVTDSTFLQNGSIVLSGAISIGGVAELELSRNRFCENGSLTNGAIYLENVGSVEAPARVTSNVFLRNDGPYGATVASVAGSVDLRNNTFADNVSTPDLGSVDVQDTSLAFTHNLFVANTAGALSGAPDIREVAHNWTWENSATSNSSDATDADPSLQRELATLGCEEPIWVDYGSPTRERGDGSPDPDGSPVDVGAYGGPQADAVSWSDDDGDGAPLMWDCDAADPELGLPFATFADEDGDGVGALEEAPLYVCRMPDGRATRSGDCDDLDDGVSPDLFEAIGDGIDQNCDGSDGVSFVVGGGGCGCASNPSFGVGVGWVLIVAGARRRPIKAAPAPR